MTEEARPTTHLTADEMIEGLARINMGDPLSLEQGILLAQVRTFLQAMEAMRASLITLERVTTIQNKDLVLTLDAKGREQLIYATALRAFESLAEPLGNISPVQQRKVPNGLEVSVRVTVCNAEELARRMAALQMEWAQGAPANDAQDTGAPPVVN